MRGLGQFMGFGWNWFSRGGGTPAPTGDSLLINATDSLLINATDDLLIN